MKITKTTSSNKRRAFILRYENIRFNKDFRSFINSGLCENTTLQITRIYSYDHGVFISQHGGVFNRLVLIELFTKRG